MVTWISEVNVLPGIPTLSEVPAREDIDSLGSLKSLRVAELRFSKSLVSDASAIQWVSGLPISPGAPGDPVVAGEAEEFRDPKDTWNFNVRRVSETPGTPRFSGTSPGDTGLSIITGVCEIPALCTTRTLGM